MRTRIIRAYRVASGKRGVGSGGYGALSLFSLISPVHANLEAAKRKVLLGSAYVMG